MAHDIFISYSSVDKVVADAVCNGLESREIRCWMAPRDVRPGQEWAATIVDAIEGCRIFVIILSSGSNKSSQVLREVERAVNAGKIVIPFRIENLVPSKSLGYFLSVPHWLDAMTGPMEEHIAALATEITLLTDADPAGRIDDPLARPSWSGTLMKSTLRDRNRLNIIIAVLLTVIVLGMGWFLLYERGHQPSMMNQPAGMGSGMKGRGSTQNWNNWQ